MFLKLHDKNDNSIWINMDIIKCIFWNRKTNLAEMYVFNDPNGFCFQVKETPDRILELMKNK